MNYYEEQHRIWELRHSFCNKCHEMTEDPCICGPEPCKTCGQAQPDTSLNEKGCDGCNPPEKAIKTIDIESTWMMLCVGCPYCSQKQSINGNNTMGGFDAAVFECCACNKRAWLGEDGEYDHDDIAKVSYVNKGSLL